MNTGGRARHRVMTTTLAAVLPLVFVAGLLARPGIVSNGGPLPAVDAPLVEYTKVRWSHDAVSIAGGIVDVRILEGPAGPPLLAVEFAPRSAIIGADVLIYWTPAIARNDALPEVSLLVGTLAGEQPRKYRLPEMAGRTLGHLVFYSLAKRALVEGSITVDPGQL